MGYGVAFPPHYPPKAGKAAKLQGKLPRVALQHSPLCLGNGWQSGTIARAQMAIARAITHRHCPGILGPIAAPTEWLPWHKLGKNQVRWNT